MSSGVIKVRNWEEFKRLAIELKPKALVYNIEQRGLSVARELTCLRMISMCEEFNKYGLTVVPAVVFNEGKIKIMSVCPSIETIEASLREMGV